MSVTAPEEPPRTAPEQQPFLPRAAALVLAGLGVGITVQLVVMLLLGGGSPQPSAAGLPDPGPITGWAIPLLRLLSDVAAVVAAAGLLVPLFVARSTDQKVTGRARRPLRAARYALFVWLVAALANAWFTTSDLIAQTPGQLDLSAVWSYLTDVPAGRSVLAEILLLGAAVLRLTWSLRVAEVAWSLALAAVALIPRILTGHSAQAGSHDLAVLTLALHVLAATAWVAGILALGWLLLQRNTRVEVARRRFGPVAATAIVVVAVTGLINASIRLQSVDALFTTPYGREVLVKLALLGAIAVLATRLRRLPLPPLGLLAVELGLLVAAMSQGVALSRTPTPVGEPYTSAAESLLGGPLPPAPDLGRHLLGFELSGFGLIVVGFGAAGYFLAVRRMRQQQNSWPWQRTLAWFAGLAVIAYATMGGLSTYSHVMFSAHMTSHMLLSMVAPALLVMGAPVTLALRALPGPQESGGIGARQLLMAAIESRWARFFTHPVVATLIFVGSLYAIYFSPAFTWLMERHLGHAWMEAHFLIAGFLFFDVLIGIDPLPKRPPHLARLAILLVAMPFHAFFSIAVMSSETVLGEAFYRALDRPFATDLLADQNLGGSLAWAFGEIPMLIVGIALLAQWLRSDQRAAKRHDRREDRDLENSEWAEYNEMLRRRAEATSARND